MNHWSSISPSSIALSDEDGGESGGGRASMGVSFPRPVPQLGESNY